MGRPMGEATTRAMNRPTRALLALAFVLSALSTAASAPPTAPPKSTSVSLPTWIHASAPGAPQAAAAGDLDCVGCHDDAIESFSRTAHRSLDREESQSRWHQGSSCAACHGDAGEHVDQLGDGPIFAFDRGPAENSAMCLECHATTHPSFPRSEHARAGIGCTDCHESHPSETPGVLDVPNTLKGRPSAQCVDCHQAAFTEFSFTAHHRLEQGTIECTSCHDPHAPEPRVQLAGFSNERCVQCHTDKSGPFVFEHGAQRVEGCTACHSAHGSPNRHLLHFQRVAEQCYSCHAFVPGFHTRFDADTQCTNCHATIHGSNLDAGFLK